MKAPPSPASHNAFTVKHSGLARRIHTTVHVSHPFAPASPPHPMPVLLERTALWDTGATGSVITKSTAAALELIPTGMVNVSHAGGTSVSNTYIINMFLPNQVGIAGVTVHECPDNAGDFGVIIGMDIISRGDFALTNKDGLTVLSFCIPSLRVIDYVVEINRNNFAGVRRNEPCPCGARYPDGNPKKFKDCHSPLL